MRCMGMPAGCKRTVFRLELSCSLPSRGVSGRRVSTNCAKQSWRVRLPEGASRPDLSIVRDQVDDSKACGKLHLFLLTAPAIEIQSSGLTRTLLEPNDVTSSVLVREHEVMPRSGRLRIVTKSVRFSVRGGASGTLQVRLTRVERLGREGV